MSKLIESGLNGGDGFQMCCQLLTLLPTDITAPAHSSWCSKQRAVCQIGLLIRFAAIDFSHRFHT